MKKKGNKSDYIESRNENLRREFFSRLGKNGRKVSDAIEALSLASADRFYISEERAYDLIKKLYTSDETVCRRDTLCRLVKNRERREMLSEILRKVKVVMEEKGECMLKDVVFEVVNSPAPAFYLSRKSIRTILYEVLKRKSAGF